MTVRATALRGVLAAGLIAAGCGSSGGGGDVHAVQDALAVDAGIDTVRADARDEAGGVADTKVTGDAAVAQDLADTSAAGTDADAVAGELPADVADADSDVPGPGSCLAPWLPGSYLSDMAQVEWEDQGVSSWEWDAFDEAADALLAVPTVFFVDTYLADKGTYLVRTASSQVEFTRTFGPDGPQFAVVASSGPDPFPCKDAAGLNTYEEELQAGANPMGTQLESLGYAVDDPRVSFVETSEHCYPFPYLRIAQLYDAPNAPDFHYGYVPYGVPGVATHGNFDVFQARASLVVSGKGLAKGYDDTSTPLQADVAPTALYLMGAVAAEGLSHGVPHSATLLKWQDGTPLAQVVSAGCVEPFDYVFVFLFDGLESNELTHLLETGEVPLPAFQAIAADGTVFRNGAIAGYPTVSAPGHLTVGTGMLQGHSRFVGNGFYYRQEKLVLNPGDIMAKASEYVDNPQAAMDLFSKIFNPAGETVFEAAHRHFGDSLFAASVNGLTLRGADYNLVTLVRAMGGRLDYYELADTLAVPQVTDLLDKHAASSRMLVTVSFFKTDDAGEGGGPHGKLLRDKLVAVDAQLAVFLAKLDALGIRERSAIILTSDHGMELQDPSRSQSAGPALSASGLKYLDPDGFGFVYLSSMRVTCTVACEGADGCLATIQVLNDDTLEPVEGALATWNAPACTAECSGTTGPGGAVVLTAALDTQEVTVVHPQFNAASATCE